MTIAVVTKNFGEVNDIVYSLKIYFVLPDCVLLFSSMLLGLSENFWENVAVV